MRQPLLFVTMAQRKTSTFFNRDPDVFRTVQARILKERDPSCGGGALRVLSFGCSSGAEILALRGYFSEATILGRDVDLTSILASGTEGRRAGIYFESTPESLRSRGSGNLVFTMSVLCLHPLNGRPITETFSFNEFSRLCSLIDEALVPSEIFCFYNPSHPIPYLPSQSRYGEIRSPLLVSNGLVDKWNPERVGVDDYFNHQRKISPEIGPKMAKGDGFVFDENQSYEDCRKAVGEMLESEDFVLASDKPSAVVHKR